MIGELAYLGFTRTNTPLALRERLHGDAQQAGRLVAALRNHAPECMILQTCERTELYAWTARCHPDDWLTVWADCCNLPVSELRDHCQTRTGQDVGEHLLRVAAGLDSRLLGEDQIQSQVRQAYLRAAERRWIGPILSALGRAAIHTGKRVRSSVPALGRTPSAAALTAAHLEGAGVTLQTSRILIVGAGQLAGSVARTLHARGAINLFIASRSLDRARRLAAETDAQTLPFNRLIDHWTSFDAVVTCDRSTGYLLSGLAGPVPSATPVQLVDLGVPRNIDPAIGAHPDCRLVHLEQLSPAARESSEARKAAERIVADELDRFARWLAARGVSAEVDRLKRNAALRGRKLRGDELHAQIMRLKAQVAA